jgi:hypothetical protein
VLLRQRLKKFDASSVQGLHAPLLPPCISTHSPRCDPNDAININEFVIVDDGLHPLRAARAHITAERHVMAGSYHDHNSAHQDIDDGATAHTAAGPFAAFMRLRAWMTSPRQQHHNDAPPAPLNERAFLAHLLAQLGDDYEIRRQKSQS